MLFFMEIILPDGHKPCPVISKAISCGFISLLTVLFQKKWTKKLILPMSFELRIGKVLIIISLLGFVIHLFHPLLMSLTTLILPKEVWDLLVTWHAGQSGARNFKLTRKLYQICQEPSERITVYHSRLKSIWDQLVASEPVLSNSTDTKLVYVHREQGQLFQFLMGLRDEFESARSHILHHDPLPTVSQAIHKLIDDETRLQTDPISIQTMVLTTLAAVLQTVTPFFSLCLFIYLCFQRQRE